MWQRRGGAIRVRIAPSAVLLLAALVLLSSPQLISAVLAAALCHEWGHYRALRHYGCGIAALTVTARGVEMQRTGRLSYGQEIRAVAAGPMVNLLLAALCSVGGHFFPTLYLYAGTQLILGLFNLIPAGALDGGTILWLAVAWLTDPFVADGVSRGANLLAAAAALLAAVYLWRQGGSPFLLLAAALLFWQPRGKRSCQMNGFKVK